MQKDINTDSLLSELLFQMQEAKAEDITLINLKDLDNRICDYFIIAHGNSSTHTGSIASRVDRETSKKLRVSPLHTEGFINKMWVLLDYGDIVVHVFSEQQRAFYNLEELWKDAKITQIL